jgi:hypothetical protein
MATDQQSPDIPQPNAVANDSAPEPAVARLDREGRDRPAFILAFPRDPELDALVGAFESGNFALIREAAPKLAASTTDPAIRDAALELRRRIDPDPTVVRLLLLSFALLIFIAIWGYTAQH